MRITLLFILCCAILHISSTNSNSYECSADLFDNMEMKEPKTDLSIYDKVYLKIVCEKLHAGEYTFIVNWVNPNDKVVAHDRHTFMVDSPGPQIAFFWFRLLKKGPFERRWLNSDYQKENYGLWEVYVYSGGELIVSKQFNLQ